MEVSKKKWETATRALIDRRKTGVQDNAKCEPIIADYGRHLRAVEKHGSGVGTTVLDVGCGDMGLSAKVAAHSQYSSKQHTYFGVDAFPVSEHVTKACSEELPFNDGEIETVICFAVLDSTRDAELSVAEMCRVSSKNVVLLTGIDIEPDKYHTHKISESWLHEQFSKHGYVSGLSNYLEPNVLLIEFVNNNVQPIKVSDIFTENLDESKATGKIYINPKDETGTMNELFKDEKQ